MSFDLVRAVRELPLKSPAKAVLLVLALRANENAACWPSVATIARESGYDARTVQRAVASLVASGLLSRELRASDVGDNVSSIYRLTLAAVTVGQAGATDGHPAPAERHAQAPAGSRAPGDSPPPKDPLEPIKNEDPDRCERRTARGTRLAPDWAPSAALVTFAREQGVTDVDRVTDEFRDYWRGVPGHKGVKLDWDATFRNQIRFVAGKRGAARPTRSGPMKQPMLGDAPWMRLPSERR